MVKILFETDLCLGCKSCELACAAAHSKTKSIAGAIKEREISRLRIKTKRGKMKLEQCMLCKNPRCIAACPTGALSKDEESGIIHVNEMSCTGCGLCQKACPFDAIELQTFPTICDRCAQSEEPLCVLSCPTRALKVKIV
ncbi:4Fe-4S binding protein [Tepidanaerobacter sp. GT38]|uniref:4Fe-4S dicluster domain-containing protein n=1 Tax=Tepidanaerobacter sp. GT38 TaxID=2722793 RepID=UPI001F1B25E0|nr:4Fe-4S binding protein [Tepidanaerobacter sp. GT38]MCG1011425.1 4Fe-4S binding protein [Tepidanaerobacter sp. GT38]